MIPDYTDKMTGAEHLLERLRQGDNTARDDLVRFESARLTVLARRMLRDYPGVKRWEETDDVVQSAIVRLWKALAAVTPECPAAFHRLAALELRRELIDLVRHYQGPEGSGAHHFSTSGIELEQSTNDPGKLAAWTEFHRRVSELPEAERDLFDTLWYQGLSLSDASKMLGIPERTLRRKWRDARLRLFSALNGGPFE